MGNLPLARALLRRGVRDLVRISDARMSGTVVLHVSPEAAAGGPLALVRDGDMIELDVEHRRLHLDISAAELTRRRRQWRPPPPPRRRGAAIGDCTSTTSSRPTGEPTSTSWSADAGCR
ncbi:dihydroxy-acid dehydratase [Acrocarpospora sp. B8E8]|uniref:dihydroxy-acid dehydratase domain-containing protein n=1 Tax=Acrocarpospora sp. B8E8 TaxID=3153572 RepID=UPI00325D58B0